MTTISTTAKPAYVYDSVADAWFPVGAQAIAFVTNYVYTATAAQTVFSGVDDNSQTLSYTTGAIKVFLNGALLTPDTDYSALNGTSVTLALGASVNDILVIVASDTFQIADTYTIAQADTAIATASVVINAQAGSGSYTIVLTDRNKQVELSGGGTLTVPLNSTTAFPIGSFILIVQTGATQVTIAGAAGVTVNSANGLKMFGQWSAALLVKRETNTWLLAGDTAP